MSLKRLHNSDFWRHKYIWTIKVKIFLIIDCGWNGMEYNIKKNSSTFFYLWNNFKTNKDMKFSFFVYTKHHHIMWSKLAYYKLLIIINKYYIVNLVVLLLINSKSIS